MVECEDGYDRSGNTNQYNCDLDGMGGVTWMFDGREVSCSPVQCSSLSDPENGNVTCFSTTSIFQNTCTYYCNRGYQLNGNRQPSCTADGTWSSEPVTCTILTCNDPEMEITNSQSVGVCNMTYGSRCSLNCSSGFTTRGDGAHVCDDVNGVATWTSIGGKFRCVADGGGGSDGAAIGGAIGGVIFVVAIIIVVLLVIVFVRKAQKKKERYFVGAESSHSTSEGCKTSSTLCFANEVYQSSTEPLQPVYEDTSIVITNDQASISIPQLDYEEPDLSGKASFVDKAISSMKRQYNVTVPAQYELPSSSTCTVRIYEMEGPAPYEIAESMEDEQQIYETPCEIEEDIGPVYLEPSSDEHKIYEEFEGKRFRKLCHSEVTSFEELGTGEFGVVNRGMWKPSSTKEVEVAIKTLNSDSTDKDRVRFLQEAAIMCQFDHENVIKLHGVVTEAPSMIVLEYMSRGDLRSLLLKLQSSGNTHPKLPIVLLKFCQEVAAGMTYLSAKHFVHRDLAARNILVSDLTTCKIADFGMSRDLLNENYYVTSGGKIPVKWTAPEALYYRKYSLYSDVWSYGCVLYEIWSLGHKPFEDMSANETIERIDAGHRLPPPPGCPRTMYRIMIKCWNREPRSRPQFGQIKKLLDGSGRHLLGWSDEDREIAGEDAMKLGAPLESAKNLYYDLQMLYNKQTQ